MKFKISLIALLIGLTTNVIAQYDIPDKKWQSNWESLKSRPYPQWFKDAKLGIFIHFL